MIITQPGRKIIRLSRLSRRRKSSYAH